MSASNDLLEEAVQAYVLDMLCSQEHVELVAKRVSGSMKIAVMLIKR